MVQPKSLSKSERFRALTRTVSALEFSPRFGRIADGLALVERALETLQPRGLVLLPEAALTGYVSEEGDFDLRRFAEPLTGPTATALSRAAKRHRVALAGPLIEHDDDTYYNSLVLFDARGERVGHWRKRHPWYPERWASAWPGLPPVVEVAGLRVTAAICFDIQFTGEIADALHDADVLLFPSAWVEDEDSRPKVLAEVAREHAVTVVNANWGPTEPHFASQGRSIIVSPEGAIVAAAPETPGPHLISTNVLPRWT